MTHAATKEEESDYHGHRQRLREWLLGSGANSLQDYELLVKPLVRQLLSKFKNLWSLANASPEQPSQFGLSESAAATLLVTGAIALRAQKKAIVGGALLNNLQRMVDYCRMAMAHETVEQFRLLFLDRKNHLIAEEVQQHGTIDHPPVYPREVVKRALEIGVGAFVLAHNHPSGDPTPSKEDIYMTRAIMEARRPLGIAIHDHIIIGHGEVVSFKSLGLL